MTPFEDAVDFAHGSQPSTSRMSSLPSLVVPIVVRGAISPPLAVTVLLPRHKTTAAGEPALPSVGASSARGAAAASVSVGSS